MNWTKAYETLDRHRSEVERMKLELQELVEALADELEASAKARVMHENCDAVVRDLELINIGIGASRRMALREAEKQGGDS